MALAQARGGESPWWKIGPSSQGCKRTRTELIRWFSLPSWYILVGPPYVGNSQSTKTVQGEPEKAQAALCVLTSLLARLAQRPIRKLETRRLQQVHCKSFTKGTNPEKGM